jgi:membrane protein Man1
MIIKLVFKYNKTPFFFSALAVIFTIYLIAKWYTRRNARYQDEVYKLVSNILDIVSSKAHEQENNFVPISHVRDQLIPPKDRQSMFSFYLIFFLSYILYYLVVYCIFFFLEMSKMWNDAITFLESDSRLRSEVQNVEGEEFLVWRWLASPLTSK